MVRFTVPKGGTGHNWHMALVLAARPKLPKEIFLDKHKTDRLSLNSRKVRNVWKLQESQSIYYSDQPLVFHLLLKRRGS